MITLPIEFKSGVDGFLPPLNYKQIIRKDTFAVYQRFYANGKPKDFESIKIRLIPKGTSIFNSPPSIEDEERYAATSSWGRCGFSFGNEHAAIKKMEEMIQKGIDSLAEEENEKLSVKIGHTIPDKDFTTGEFAISNNIPYSEAFLSIKSLLAENKIKFVREERRNVKGKLSKIYSIK